MGHRWETCANNFRFASTEIVPRSQAEVNIAARMLVKCRALASVTVAVGNKIAVLQAGTLHVITTQTFLVYLFWNRVAAQLFLPLRNRMGDLHVARESRGKSIHKPQIWSRSQFFYWKYELTSPFHLRYVYFVWLLQIIT